MPLGRLFLSTSAAFLLAALPLVAAHGEEHGHSNMAMNMGGAHSSTVNTTPAALPSAAPENYFRHPEFAGWMYAHIVLMVTAWAVVLPAGE